MRLIDADTFKENMERKYGYYARQPQDDIDAQPTVDAAPVVHGHWTSIDEDERGYAEEYECSVCKRDTLLGYYDTDCDYQYCPYCGAKMDGKDGKVK